jgi:spore germination cell wall hydrolase CwlJ-like protein
MKKLIDAFVAIIVLTLLTAGLFGAEPSEHDVVAMTILGEARGEGKAGMYAVACVIQERIKSKHWPNTMNGVCLQKSQFDFWTERKSVTWDDDNRAAVRHHMTTNTKLAQYAKRLAINLDNLDRSFVGNADHYCTLDTHRNWTKGKIIKVIGNHKFFKLRK